MKKWFATLPENLWPIAVTAVAVYLAVIICTRIAGKRSFSKMSSFDFSVTIAIGSLIASTIVLKSVSLQQGLVALISLYLLQMTVAALRRFQWVQKLVDNQPLLLMEGTEILEENLKKARITVSDLKGKLREANVTHRQQIKAVIFESTGDISVLHESAGSDELDPWLMQGVGK